VVAKERGKLDDLHGELGLLQSGLDRLSEVEG
jgi:hypothetical protein